VMDFLQARQSDLPLAVVAHRPGAEDPQVIKMDSTGDSSSTAGTSYPLVDRHELRRFWAGAFAKRGWA
jgi:hypothetical protein